ncbi:MAG: hypothetical protein Q8L27_02355 [archaeon]|nr:hypothetical protein [archaeon]
MTRQLGNRKKLWEALNPYLIRTMKTMSIDLRNIAQKVLTESEYEFFVKNTEGAQMIWCPQIRFGLKDKSKINFEKSSHSQELEDRVFDKVICSMRDEQSKDRIGESYDSMPLLERNLLTLTDLSGAENCSKQSQRNLQFTLSAIYDQTLQKILSKAYFSLDPNFSRDYPQTKILKVGDLYHLCLGEIDSYAHALRIPCGPKTLNVLTSIFANNGLPALAEDITR